MIDMQVFYWIGGIVMSVIGFFLKEALDGLKEAKKDIKRVEDMVGHNKSEVDVLRNDYLNKHDALSEKFIDLKESMHALTKEIKSLTLEISKKKD